MKVSVIIPCYNLGRYLEEAVASVLAQTFQDLEIVIVDDGSTEDETRRILDGFRNPRTRLVRSVNRGLPAAKNLGLVETTGPYVCMLDADDRLEPTMIEKSVATLDADPSIAFVSHWLRTFGDESWEWTPERCDFPALLDLNTVNGAALVRRTALEAVGGFDETFRDGCEDWDIWISLVERGFSGRILPEFLFHYRRRADSMSRVMMRGEGHPRLYRQLVAKHERTFAEHLRPLVSRREGDVSNLRRHAHDLELEHYTWLEPELTKWRSDVEMLERKSADVERRRADAEARTRLEAAVAEAQAARADAERLMQEERARAEAALNGLHADHERLRVDLDTLRADRDHQARGAEVARQRALQIHADFNRARQEADGLRQSVSWRAMAPFRRLYAGLRRAAGRDRS